MCANPNAFLNIPVCYARSSIQRLKRRHLYADTPQCGPLQCLSIQSQNPKTKKILVREMLFADDSAVVAHSAEDIQKLINSFAKAAAQFSLRINIKKTDRMFIPVSR